jgi:hypothetical protein
MKKLRNWLKKGVKTAFKQTLTHKPYVAKSQEILNSKAYLLVQKVSKQLLATVRICQKR